MLHLRKKIRLVHVCALCLVLSFLMTILVVSYRSLTPRNEYPFKEEFQQLQLKKIDEDPTILADTAADYLLNLSEKLRCIDKSYEFRIDRRGEFWVMKNYVRARKTFNCYETITYTTHVDFTFLDNLEPLVERWLAPVSVAVYCPGEDYQKALESVIYVRNCLNHSNLIKDYVTFHFFFDRNHTPKGIIRNLDIIEKGFQCVVDAPYVTYGRKEMYKTMKNLFYPINVARNIAREAALTHFVLASDIELYPNPGLVQSFLEMYSYRNIYKYNEVFVLPIFEVEKNTTVPQTKLDLQKMLKKKTAIRFHVKICASCHSVPKNDEWINAETPSEMRILATTKRKDKFAHWEPIYIGTNMEPMYEEQLHWEGKSDKMTQGYTLCLLDYEFHVLSEGFLVHRPGIKTVAEARRVALEAAARKNLLENIVPQIEALYGKRVGCHV